MCIFPNKEEIIVSVRTDLAVESAEQLSLTRGLEGVSRHVDTVPEAQLEITDISIETPRAAKLMGRPCGRYITLRALDGAFDSFSPCFERRARIVSQQLEKLCENAKSALVVGLGNRAITPDAVGPLCADRIFATRHIKRYAKEMDSEDLGEISVTQTGVMGTTGIESAEYIGALCASLKPQIVVAVDALACSELSHLGSTIQLCNTGISPGSGVNNARKELSRSTLGVTCVAVGVPTVMDLTSAAEGIFGSSAPDGAQSMMVTPRNVDKLAANAAGYISLAVNLCFHKGLTPEELRSLTE